MSARPFDASAHIGTGVARPRITSRTATSRPRHALSLLRVFSLILHPSAFSLSFILYTLAFSLSSHAAWWESPHDKWYLKDDWKAAPVNNYSPSFKLLSPATNGWIALWGDRGVNLRVNGKPVMKHVDRGLIYNTNLTELIRGETNVNLQVGPGRVLAEGELIDNQGRRYPFASGCDWPSPTPPGTRLEPSPRAYRPGESSGAFHSAHNGLLMYYNDEESGKSTIAKNLARIQKLQDQSIFLLRRFRSAEDILDFSPNVLWRKAESYANPLMTSAEKILKEQATTAQKEGRFKDAISLAQSAGVQLARAELAINSTRELEEAERQLNHLQACAELISTSKAVDSRALPQIKITQNSLGKVRELLVLGPTYADSDTWDKLQKTARDASNALANCAKELESIWGAPLNRLDEFPEDRFGWFNAQKLLPNDPADWEFTLVNPSADCLDLSGLWWFSVDPPNKGEDSGWHKPGFDTTGWRLITVPREWEREGILAENDHAPWDCPYKLGDLRCENKPYNGYAWYRRRLVVPNAWSGKKLVLRITKVSNWLRVFWNGTTLGEPRRDGGTYELAPDLVKFGQENTLAIQIYNHDNFGGIVGGPISLSVEDKQPDVIVTPGTLTWAYETTVHTPGKSEHITALASQLAPAVAVASDQEDLHFWGWEAKGYRCNAEPVYKLSPGKKPHTFEQLPVQIPGADFAENWLLLPFDPSLSLMHPLLLVFEQTPASVIWGINRLGSLELTIRFPNKGARVLVHRMSVERIPPIESVSEFAKRLRSSPVACSQLARLDRRQLRGEFFLKYHYLALAWPEAQKPEPFAPVPNLFRPLIQNLQAPPGIEMGVPGSMLRFTNHLRIGLNGMFFRKATEEFFAFRTNSTTLSYRTPLIDKSKLLKGVGELFAKRRPDLNSRGGNTEQQMFDDWKAWGFDHCRYAFAWGAEWDLPLQRRMGGPITDDPALWSRLDYLVKQHTDRGIMAMLCYFFNEDSPQRDSKNLMRNSTRYWQMHPETRTNCYELWRRIAQRYANYPEHLVAYDFFNEPAYMHRDDWNRILKDLTQIVRSVDKKHLIVCEAGDGWSQPQWFHWLEPTGDTNTIYSFHHYGKHWGYNYDEYYPGYKSTPEKQMDVLLEAIQFGLRHNVPMHCGEFGVSMISPGDDHLVWLDDYLALFERFGIGWNWWNWDGNGIYRTGLKAGDELSPNLPILQKSIARKKLWSL